jgi:hypothetical protein
MSFQWGVREYFRPIRHHVFVSYQQSRDQAHYDPFSRVFHDTHDAVLDNSFERRVGDATDP